MIVELYFCWILNYRLKILFVSSWKLLIHFILAPVVLMNNSLWYEVCFPVVKVSDVSDLNILNFILAFRILAITCLHMDFFRFVLFEIFSVSWIYIYSFSQIWKIFSHYFFAYFYRPMISWGSLAFFPVCFLYVIQLK